MSATFGAVIGILVFLPMSLGIALGCGAGFHALAPPFNEHLLRGVLLAIYFFWLLTPLLGYALTDSYDITKLFLYPLTARQIFTGAIFGSLIDFPVLLLLPTLIAVLIGFGSSAAVVLLALLSLGLFLFHTLSLSQAAILASAGFLRSRRFRDFVVILLPLFWMSYYVLSHTLTRQLAQVDWRGFLQSPTWAVLSLLPPGLAARAVGAAGQGNYLTSLGFLLVLLLFTVGTVYLAGWLIERVYAGEVISPVRAGPGKSRGVGRQSAGVAVGAGSSPRPAASSARPAVVPAFFRLPPVIEAVADKELKYLLRDPYFKLALMNVVYMLAVGAVAFLGHRGSESVIRQQPILLWSATGLVFLSEIQLLFNIFGTEGGAAALLFLFPSSRRQILMGKNLSLFAALSLVNLAFVIILTALADALPMFGLLFGWMELAILVFVAVGNLMSIWFPVRVVLRGWRIRQQSASRGCAYSFVYLTVAYASFALLAPPLAGLLLPTYWVNSVWYALGIPLAVAYAVGAYLLSLRLAEPLLLEREHVMIERLGQEE